MSVIIQFITDDKLLCDAVAMNFKRKCHCKQKCYVNIYVVEDGYDEAVNQISRLASVRGSKYYYNMTTILRVSQVPQDVFDRLRGMTENVVELGSTIYARLGDKGFIKITAKNIMCGNIDPHRCREIAKNLGLI